MSSIETLYDLALVKAGGFGNFQKLATIIIVAGHVLINSVFKGLLFFLLKPSYLCLVDISTGQYESCDASDICDDGLQVREFKLDYD